MWQETPKGPEAGPSFAGHDPVLHEWTKKDVAARAMKGLPIALPAAVLEAAVSGLHLDLATFGPQALTTLLDTILPFAAPLPPVPLAKRHAAAPGLYSSHFLARAQQVTSPS